VTLAQADTAGLSPGGLSQGGLSPGGLAPAGLSPVDVALDPGHSRADVGASGGGLREYEVSLDLAQRARERLEAAGLSVRLTRQDVLPLTALTQPAATAQTAAEQQARIAAGGPARVYVSLHLNGGPVSLRGTETYYNPARAPEASTADWALAYAIQRHVVASLAAVGYPTLDRGVRNDLLAGKPYGHFFSLRGPEPSALLEALFLSNPTEAALLRADDTRDAIAEGVTQGVLEYLAVADN
jgi:N-acetylmuramoyl-L-alanine amidase